MKDGRLICMKGGRCIEEMERSSVRRFKKLTDGWGCGGMKKFIRGSHGSIEGLRAPQTKYLVSIRKEELKCTNLIDFSGYG